ncbi:circadian-associated transcriptional repressor [Clupea harengus]|uniref:Circadian-associated transcriptional repressor n=1 Tax=Clupea harengus TaxID=7950 RepID=A0A6P3WFS1_CLUHA|nr:circadian-associated transcriptional repressor [Clupea harengus]
MQTTGRTPSPPSHDSLSSSDSFLFSDSDPVEDDTDVFLSEGDASRVVRPSSRAAYSGLQGDALASPGSQWACDGFKGPEKLEVGARRPTPLSSSVSSSSTSGAWSASESEGPSEKEGPSQGDLLFTQKCLELQCFVRPMLELLHGLKNGRFDRGLSSFQQSVAMDRIQRIVGVLQKPNSGEKYLNTLLQVEMMLKLWFPQVSPQASSAPPASAAPQAAPSSASSPAHNSTLPHKHKDQLHMPVKKRRLSWSDTDSSTPPPFLCKRFQVKGALGLSLEGESSSQSQRAPETQRGPDQHRDGEQGSSQSKEDVSAPPAPHSSEPSLTWVHVAPILSPPKSCNTHEVGVAAAAGQKGSYLVMVASPPASRGSPAMQDSSVSSTTPVFQSLNPVLQPSGGAPNQPDTPASRNDSPVQGRVQATTPPITTRPLSRAEPVTRPGPVQS